MNKNNENDKNLSPEELDQLNFLGDLKTAEYDFSMHPSLQTQPPAGMGGICGKWTPQLPPDFPISSLYFFGGVGGGPNQWAGILAGGFEF